MSLRAPYIQRPPVRGPAPWIVAFVVLALSVGAGVKGAGPGLAAGASVTYADGSQAVDTHDYPRTYHLWGTGTADELARYDMVVGFSWFPIAGLRALNPNGIFLLTPALTSATGRDAVHVTAPGGAANWPGGTDNEPGGVNLGYMRAVDPAWDLLHNTDGSYASPAGFPSIKGWNLADPTGKGTPALVAKLFAYAAKKDGLYSAGWDGVHSDNWIYSAIGSNWFYGPNLDTNRDGVVEDPTALHQSWSNGLTNVGETLRTDLPTKIVGGNGAWYRPEDYAGSDPNGWLKASNYTLVEQMEKFAYTSPDSFLALTRRWLDYPDPAGQPRYMAVYQSALDSSGTPLPAAANPNDPSIMLRPDVMKSMRWGLTLSLMTDVYYEINLGDANTTRWWYDEYDGGVGVRRRGYLGQPLGGPVHLAEGLYRRDFQNGLALNNSSTVAQTVQLAGTFVKLRGTQNPALNDGSSITSVTIPAHDGIILLRTDSTSANPPPPAAAPPGGSSSSGSGTGLAADYFNNVNLTGLALSRTDATVNFDWGTGSPGSGVGSDNFSVRWQGQVQPLYTETYRFSTASDDGVRLWVNGQLLVNNWTDHPPTLNSGTIALTAGQKYDIKLEYYEHLEGAVAQLLWASPSQASQVIPQTQLYPAAPATAPPATTPPASAPPPATAPPTAAPPPGGSSSSGSGTGLAADYFNNVNLTGLALSRTDATVNFDWGTGSPGSGVGSDNFSVRWQGQVQPLYTETYRFSTASDDGVRLWVNGQLLVNNWTDHPPTLNSGTIALTAGQKYDIKLEYYEHLEGAVAQLLWASPSQASQVIPQTQLYPAAPATAPPATTPPASAPPPATAPPTAAPPPGGSSSSGSGTGLAADYFNNVNLTGLALSRTDATVNFDWGTGSPGSGVGSDNFSVRWQGQVQPLYTETYRFSTASDDGVRLWVNGQLLVNNWTDHPPTLNSGTIALTAGQKYDIKLEYYEHLEGAVAQLLWASPSQASQVIPQTQLYPAH